MGGQDAVLDGGTDKLSALLDEAPTITGARRQQRLSP